MGPLPLPRTPAPLPLPRTPPLSMPRTPPHPPICPLHIPPVLLSFASHQFSFQPSIISSATLFISPGHTISSLPYPNLLFFTMTQCAHCNQPVTGHGHNGVPLVDGTVCDTCNALVIQERVRQILHPSQENITPSLPHRAHDY